ncbi:phage terminase small subunit [Escherichia coli]|nr:phage terminase small subunit [Escherichia coli]
MKSHLMNKKNMAQSCRVSATAFDKWGVTPVERKGREAFYDVASVIDNRVSNAINQITDDKGEIDNDELLRVRIRLLTAQAEAQELKNERERGDVISTEFCIYALSKLASQISSIMDSLPLTMQRRFPQMTPAITMEAMTMTETEALGIIRSITGISQQADEQATQPDTVTAENYARVMAEVMRRDGIELNGVDIRNIRTRVLEMLSYRRRVQMYQEKEKITYQWKKPERLRR